MLKTVYVFITMQTMLWRKHVFEINSFFVTFKNRPKWQADTAGDGDEAVPRASVPVPVRCWELVKQRYLCASFSCVTFTNGNVVPSSIKKSTQSQRYERFVQQWISHDPADVGHGSCRVRVHLGTDDDKKTIWPKARCATYGHYYVHKVLHIGNNNTITGRPATIHQNCSTVRLLSSVRCPFLLSNLNPVFIDIV